MKETIQDIFRDTNAELMKTKKALEGLSGPGLPAAQKQYTYLLGKSVGLGIAISLERIGTK